MRDPVKAILDYNRRFRGRYPDVLRHKIEIMSESPFVYYRGTCHLFASDWVEGRFDAWPATSPLRQTEVRSGGDIHSENFGTYGIDRHHLYYGVNDFDDTTTGRMDFDVCRGATSLLLAASRRNIPPHPAVTAAQAFVESYVDVLSGAPFPADPGPIVDLRKTASQPKRHEFIRKHTVMKKGQRVFHGRWYYPLRPEHRAQALRLFQDYLGRLPATARREPGFYDVEDVAGRIAGCGSLGRLRYVVLVRGEGSEEAKNVILDIKESLASALDEARGTAPRDLRHRAEEVTSAILSFQEKSDPYLGFAVDGHSSFQVRHLGPHDARLDGDSLASSKLFKETAASYGAHLAAGHRRANPGFAERLLRTGRPHGFIRRTMSFALAYAEQAEEDWQEFVKNRARLTAELTGRTARGRGA